MLVGGSEGVSIAQADSVAALCEGAGTPSPPVSLDPQRSTLRYPSGT